MAGRKAHFSRTEADEAGHLLQGASVRFLAKVENIADVNDNFDLNKQ